MTTTFSERITALLPRLSFSNKSSPYSIHFDAGVKHMESKNYADAKERFDLCLQELKYGEEGVELTKVQTERYLIPTLCHLATCHLELRQYNKTAQYCKEVLQRRPSHKRALYLQSLANVEMGSFKAAMKYLKNK